MLEQLISFFETAPLDEVTKLLKGYDVRFRRDENIEKRGKMKNIKIREWEDLVGLESEDRWGNKTVISEHSGSSITILTLASRSAKVREIYLDYRIKGGHERILEELKMCGFDVEFIEKPVLTDRQKLELRYFKEVLNMSWIAKDVNEELWAYAGQPFKKLHNWNCVCDCKRLKLDYNFISWKDDNPWCIKELLGD